MLAFAKNVEVMVTTLPESTWRLIFPQCNLVGACPLAAASPGHSLLQNLHRQGETSAARLADQKMKVLGHHYVDPDHKVELMANFLKDFEKHIAASC